MSLIIVHPGDKILARLGVPGLEGDGVAVFLKLPGDPFSPSSVGFVVADEEVARMGHERGEG